MGVYIKTLKALIIFFFLSFVFSCSNESPSPLTQPSAANDTVIHTVKAALDSIKGRVPEIELEINKQNLMDCDWTVFGFSDFTNFSFTKDNKLLLSNVVPGKAETAAAQWDLKEDTLVLIINSDTISYQIKKINAAEMELKLITRGAKNLLGENYRNNDGAIISVIVKDAEHKQFSEKEILGAWSNGDRFIFNADGTLNHLHPPCDDNVTGYWNLKNDVLSLSFNNSGCKKSEMETRYNVVKVTDHWLVLKDGKERYWERYKD